VLDNASETKSAINNGDHGLAVVEDMSKPLPGPYVPPEGEGVDVFRLLDQLEELPEKAKHLPLHTLVGFDSDKFYYLVLKIRANLPDDLKKAHRVARDSERIVDEARDSALQQVESGRVEANRLIEAARAEHTKVVEDAREDARRTVDQAHAQAAQLVEKSEIHKMASAQANEIIRRSETEANEIRKGADDYARDVLANIEGVVGKALATIQQGRSLLDKARNGNGS